MSPTARSLYQAFEPVHAVTYFAPQAREAYEAAGLRGYWRGYFGGRAAALGRTPATTVTALFGGFAPAMVERAIPSVWELVPPERVLEARLAGASEALRALPLDAAEVAEAAEIGRAAAQAAARDGRALGAAEASVRWPDDPIGRLWRAATILRELRGDGHIAAMVTAGLSGLESLLVRAGHDLPRSSLQPARGWTDEQWDAAAAGLRARGLLGDDDRATAAALDLLAEAEEVTDRLAAQPWTVVGEDAAARFVELVRPIARRSLEAYPGAVALGLAPR